MNNEALMSLKEKDFTFVFNPADYGRIKEEFSKAENKEIKGSVLEYITTEQVTYLTVSVFGFLSFVIILVLLRESFTSLLDLRKDVKDNS